MGLLSSLFSAKPKTTKMRVAGLAASTIDYVINESGINVLISGSLALDKNLSPSFRSGRIQSGGDIIAVVAIADLDESEVFKTFAKTDISDAFLLEPFVDQLVYAALRQFEGQSSSFAALPTT